ncbi:hypothetical protein D3C85_1487690 [compost metagenome]
MRDITSSGSPAALCTSSMLPAKDSNCAQFKAMTCLPLVSSRSRSAVRSPEWGKDARQATARRVPTLIMTLV